MLLQLMFGHLLLLLRGQYCHDIKQMLLSAYYLDSVTNNYLKYSIALKRIVAQVLTLTRQVYLNISHYSPYYQTLIVKQLRLITNLLSFHDVALRLSLHDVHHFHIRIPIFPY